MKPSSLIEGIGFKPANIVSEQSKLFDTQVPSVSKEELVLPRYARCVLSRLCCNGHSLLLNFYLSLIGRIESLS